MLKFIAAVAFAATLSMGITAAEDTRPAAPVFAIADVAIVDVEAGRLLENQTVVLRNDRIEAIGPAADVTAPDGARTIDGRGKYLIPGLFDAHVHYIAEDFFGPMLVAHGVTFVREMGNWTESILPLRDRLNAGDALGPRMIATGAIIDGDPPVWPFSERCSTPEQGREAVARLAEAGVDQIKVYSRLKADVYNAIVEEAHARNLMAVGHIPHDITVEQAIAAGQRSCEHFERFPELIARLAGKELETEPFWKQYAGWGYLPDVDRDGLAKVLADTKAAGMVHCPTLVAFDGYRIASDKDQPRPAMIDLVPAAMIAQWDQMGGGRMADAFTLMIQRAPELLLEMHNAGVELVCGSDLANPYLIPGQSLHLEMVKFQKAGIPAAEVLRYATIKPARFCGVDDRLGTVAVGKSASLVLLNANPLDDVANVTGIDGVFHQGRYFSRADLDQMLDKLRREVSAPTTAPAAESVDLKLPGEVVRRGRYKTTFNNMPSGVEDFVIARTDNAIRIKAHNQPSGPWQKPFMLTWQVDPKFQFVRAEWNQLGSDTLNATYTRTDTAFRAEAVFPANGKTESQKLAIPESAIFTGPAIVSDFVLVGAAGLDVDESCTVPSIGFGFTSWRMDTSELILNRQKDAKLPRPDGSEPVARHYTFTYKVSNMTVTGEIWTDEVGVPLKSVVKLPFGTVESTLD